MKYGGTKAMALGAILIILVLLENAVAESDLPIERQSELENTGNEDLYDCQFAVMKMTSCSKTIVHFFLRRHEDIGHGCCHAISTIEKKCWPTTLSSFGYTYEESHILRVHCNTTFSPAEAPPTPPKHHFLTKLGFDRFARQERVGSHIYCLSSVEEIKSCSNKIVTFFGKEQAGLGADCCRRISTISLKCWPIMLTSVGLTFEEGSILRDHCDAASSPATAPLSAPRHGVPIKPAFGPISELETNRDQDSCFNSLMEIRSCSNEMSTLFVKGQINVGRHCCRALSTMIYNCWPGMLTAIGLNFQESNLFPGHCSAASSPASAPSASLVVKSPHVGY